MLRLEKIQLIKLYRVSLVHQYVFVEYDHIKMCYEGIFLSSPHTKICFKKFWKNFTLYNSWGESWLKKVLRKWWFSLTNFSFFSFSCSNFWIKSCWLCLKFSYIAKKFEKSLPKYIAVEIVLVETFSKAVVE